MAAASSSMAAASSSMAAASSSIPALKPPPGVIPNFTEPASLLKWDIICVTICLGLTSVVFFLRTYVRLVMKRQWILEDWMCLLSFMGLFTYAALTTVTMLKHGGVHEWDLTVNEAHSALYWFNASSTVYSAAILFTKITILLLYRRVFLPHKGGIFDWAIRVLMVILILYYVATVIAKIWACTPRDRIWNKSIPGTCIDVASLLNASGVFNTITDVMLLLIPVKAVWKLQINKQRKLAIVLAFTVGLLAPVFSVIGFVARLEISANPDVTYYDPEILLWAMPEIAMGLMCACFPTLASLRRRRHSPGPSQSVHHNTMNFRREGYERSAELFTTPDRHDPFEPAALGLEQLNSLTAPSAAVVTGITAGSASASMSGLVKDPQNPGFTEFGDEINGTSAIVTTVRMEHSYC